VLHKEYWIDFPCDALESDPVVIWFLLINRRQARLNIW